MRPSSPMLLAIAIALLGACAPNAASLDESHSSTPPTPSPVCGTLTDVEVGDLPAGGYVSIDGTKYVVGGLREPLEVVRLPSNYLRIGARVCIEGSTFRRLDSTTFNVIGGAVTIRQ